MRGIRISCVQGDRGAIMSLGVGSALLGGVAITLLVGLAIGLKVVARADSAADLAALSAARSVQTRSGEPCLLALKVAQANNVTLRQCVVQTDESVVIRTSASMPRVLGKFVGDATGVARAGPSELAPR